MQRTRATTILPADLPHMRYPIPLVWEQAAGLLKGKRRVDPLRYQRAIRRGWSRRMRALEGLMKRPQS